jgi:8-oxo-dGTP pyrophosphatase MutT (NUDIX family)
MNYCYCNNCGKEGHTYNQCKLPITSIGIIAFRFNNKQEREYLMIRRKDTLGYINFIRGKYTIGNKAYIINIIKQMTKQEKERLLSFNFDELWNMVWGEERLSSEYKREESVSRNKFNTLVNGTYYKEEFLTLQDLIKESKKYVEWEEPEWGFPKGRRNYQEKDFDCAMREFTEETGMSVKHIHNFQNIIPFEENFTGSNYKSYKHKYFIGFVQNTLETPNNNYEKSEVSKMEWKTYSQCMDSIRGYNLEKKKMLHNIETTLSYYSYVKFC